MSQTKTERFALLLLAVLVALLLLILWRFYLAPVQAQ